MPADNQFRHQSYDQPEDAAARARLLSVDDDGSDGSKVDTLPKIKKLLLVHGTFVGDDAFGIVDAVERTIKRLSFLPWSNRFAKLPNEIRQKNKVFVDHAYQDNGNFTQDYTSALTELSGIDVELSNWSGENNHLARSEKAVQLLAQLDKIELSGDERIMLWAHSHGGNVLAILSNLLANNHAAVSEFLEIGKQHVQDSGDWQQAQNILADHPGPHPIAKSLIMVTMGTPVRYGWDTAGYWSLLHFVNHKAEDEQPYAARPALPQNGIEIWRGDHGDWVQGFATAGTDIRPTQREKRLANRFLRSHLERGLDPNVQEKPSLWQRVLRVFSVRRRRLRLLLRPGVRVPKDGDVVLKDYGESARSVFGHGVYTRMEWLEFHWREVVRFLKGESD